MSFGEGTVVQQCARLARHPGHEWLLSGVFRRRCIGVEALSSLREQQEMSRRGLIAPITETVDALFEAVIEWRRADLRTKVDGNEDDNLAVEASMARVRMIRAAEKYGDEVLSETGDEIV